MENTGQRHTFYVLRSLRAHTSFTLTMRHPRTLWGWVACGSAQRVPERAVTFSVCTDGAQTDVPTLELHDSVSRMQV